MRNQTNYIYTDANRNELFKKTRVDKEDGSKSFYFEQSNGLKNMDGIDLILYRLPYLLKGIAAQETIFLVEGEKDVDKLMSKAIRSKTVIIATTSPGTLTWRTEWTDLLKNSNVVILYDYDKTGLKRKELLCSELYGKVKSLKVVDLPGNKYQEKHGPDITDWLNNGHTIAELLELVLHTPTYLPPGKLRTVSAEDLLTLQLPEREMLLMPFLPSQGLVLIVAKRGVGKTHIALGIAYAIASGGTFLNWTAPTPKRVLYLDGEMPAILMQERLQMLESMNQTKAAQQHLQIITPDLQEQAMPDLSTEHGRSMLEEYLINSDLIIIDNISCLFRSSSENEADSWQQAQEWALDLRRRGKSILFVHHAGKSGLQRGTSKREDILDSVLILKHPDDYKPEEGARFEISFSKARHFTGDDAKPFQAQLIYENEVYSWYISDTPENETIKQIANLKKEGNTIKEIEREMKLTKAQVELRLRKAKEHGLL
ncbi:MAG: conjugal transfer protein TraC [Epsilonproteobacteria bacterium]|nr:conjugal transfer protein TraC [Campylobacterota bacterium]|tara:strand:+ start:247 stop:1698 length:1452 start_codon:yes stop_codon:yes gene_type:complete